MGYICSQGYDLEGLSALKNLKYSGIGLNEIVAFRIGTTDTRMKCHLYSLLYFSNIND